MKKHFLFTLFALSTLALAQVDVPPTPVPVAEPLGSYSQGTLLNGEAMPESGEGFVQLYRDTNRYYATRSIIQMIIDTAKEMNLKYPESDRMQLEEMSGPNGGDLDRHSSHENGLDVDIQYYKLDRVEHNPQTAGTLYATPLVIRNKVSPNFDLERNWEFVKSLHRHGKVHRIFMDQKLKNALCSYSRLRKDFLPNTEVLRSIRHVENHKDHLHVRLRCPVNARRCIPQEDPPKGSGCP